MAGNRILIIEDNPMNLDLAADLLEVHGYVVLRAENALKGIELARAEQPDLILMDISLPDLDGLEATRKLRADPATQHLTVVALTAHAMKATRRWRWRPVAKGTSPNPLTRGISTGKSRSS